MNYFAFIILTVLLNFNIFAVCNKKKSQCNPQLKSTTTTWIKYKNPYERIFSRKKRFIVFPNYCAMKITVAMGKSIIVRYPRGLNLSLEVSVYYPLPTILEEWYPKYLRKPTKPKPTVKRLKFPPIYPRIDDDLNNLEFVDSNSKDTIGTINANVLATTLGDKFNNDGNIFQNGNTNWQWLSGDDSTYNSKKKYPDEKFNYLEKQNGTKLNWNFQKNNNSNNFLLKSNADFYKKKYQSIHYNKDWNHWTTNQTKWYRPIQHNYNNNNKHHWPSYTKSIRDENPLTSNLTPEYRHFPNHHRKHHNYMKTNWWKQNQQIISEAKKPSSASSFKWSDHDYNRDAGISDGSTIEHNYQDHDVDGEKENDFHDIYRQTPKFYSDLERYKNWKHYRGHKDRRDIYGHLEGFSSVLPTQDGLVDDYSRAMRADEQECELHFIKLCPISLLDLLMHPDI